MKPLITALGIALVLLIVGPADAGSPWVGDYDVNWSDARNWTSDTKPVANDNIAITSMVTFHPTYDNAETVSTFGTLLLGGRMILTVTKDNSLSFTSISLNGTNGDAYVQGASDWSGTSLAIDASTGAAAVALTHAGTNTLDISGAVTLTADNSADVHATLTVNASADLTPDSIDLNGDPTAANGDAILVFNEDVTVQTSTGVVATGYAQVRVGSDDTFDAVNLDVGDGYLTSQLDMNTGTGTMTATSLDIIAGDAANEDAKFLQRAGTLDVNGDVALTADSSVAADAIFRLRAGTFTPDSMTLDGYPSYGHAKLILDQDFEVDIAGTHAAPDTIMAGAVDVDVAANKTAQFKDVLYDATGTLDLTVGASGAFQTDEFKIQDDGVDAAIAVTKTGAGQVSADSLVIVGGNDVAETASLMVSAGSFVTR